MTAVGLLCLEQESRKGKWMFEFQLQNILHDEFIQLSIQARIQGGSMITLSARCYMGPGTPDQ